MPDSPSPTVELGDRQGVLAVLRALGRLVVTLVSVALAVFFAMWSGGMVGVAPDPYDSTWGVYALVAAITACLCALSILMVTSCRSPKAIKVLTLCCAVSWLLWAGLSTLTDLTPQASTILIAASELVALTAVGFPASVAIFGRNGR